MTAKAQGDSRSPIETSLTAHLGSEGHKGALFSVTFASTKCHGKRASAYISNRNRPSLQQVTWDTGRLMKVDLLLLWCREGEVVGECFRTGRGKEMDPDMNLLLGALSKCDRAVFMMENR